MLSPTAAHDQLPDNRIPSQKHTRQKEKGWRDASLFSIQSAERISCFPSGSEPDDRDTCRSSDRHGADGEVRQNSCLRHKSEPSGHQRNGACHGVTGLFFFSELPFLNSNITRTFQRSARRAIPVSDHFRKFERLIHAESPLDQSPRENFLDALRADVMLRPPGRSSSPARHLRPRRSRQDGTSWRRCRPMFWDDPTGHRLRTG